MNSNEVDFNNQESENINGGITDAGTDCDSCDDGYNMAVFYSELEKRFKQSFHDFTYDDHARKFADMYPGRTLDTNRKVCIPVVCPCENGTGFGTNATAKGLMNTEGFCRQKAYQFPDNLYPNFPFHVLSSDVSARPVDNCHFCDEKHVLKRWSNNPIAPLFNDQQQWDAVKWMKYCEPLSCRCNNGQALFASQYDMCHIRSDAFIDDDGSPLAEYEKCGVCDNFHYRYKEPTLTKDDDGNDVGFEIRCKPNQCTCENGVSNPGSCFKHQMSHCSSCYAFHHLDCANEPREVCGVFNFATNSVYDLDWCNSGNEEYIQQYSQSEAQQCQCKPNKCVCDHGECVEDQCIEHKATHCLSCDENYHLETYRTASDGTIMKKCVPNQCRCDDNYDGNAQGKIKVVGTAAQECSTRNQNLCTKCKNGYHMEDLEGNELDDGEYGICVINKCNCQDDNGKQVGIAKSGKKCKKHGSNQCDSCFNYYHLEGKKCVSNECVCKVESDGVPRGIGECWKHGANECARCNDNGYHVPDKDKLEQSPVNCVPKKCFCNNGIAVDGECAVDGGHQCKVCDEFYHLEGNKCRPNICVCRSIDPSCGCEVTGTPRANCRVHMANECASCDDDAFHVPNEVDRNQRGETPVYCEAKKCLCQNGVAVDAGSCTKNNGNQCKSCNIYYHLEDGNCVPNVCNCSNGKRNELLMDYKCLEHNLEDCDTCDLYFHPESITTERSVYDPIDDITHPIKDLPFRVVLVYFWK